MKEDLVIDGEKFQVLVERRGKMAIRVHLNGTHADATMRPLSDGGLLVQMDGRSHVVHSEEEHAAVRLQIDGRMAWLHKEVRSWVPQAGTAPAAASEPRSRARFQPRIMEEEGRREWQGSTREGA